MTQLKLNLVLVLVVICVIYQQVNEQQVQVALRQQGVYQVRSDEEVCIILDWSGESFVTLKL